MVRHALSHSLFVLISTIFAAFLVEILKSYLPEILGKVDRISLTLLKMLNISLSVEELSFTIVASSLAILWVFFLK